MVLRKCTRCGYEWDYKGVSCYFTSCPRCHGSVKALREGDAGYYNHQKNMSETKK